MAIEIYAEREEEVAEVEVEATVEVDQVDPVESEATTEPTEPTEPETINETAPKASSQEEETAESPASIATVGPFTSDLCSQISNQELRCKRAEWVVIEKKEALKEAKEEYEGCIAELRRLCSQLQNDAPANRPLFANLEAQKTDAARKEEIVTPAEPAWKSLTVDSLPDITPKTKEQLRDGNVNTLSELAELITRCEHDSTAAWPKGIGKVKQEMVVAALVTVQDLERCEGDKGVPVTKVSAVYPTTEEWEAWSDGEQMDWLNARAIELEEQYPDADQAECDAKAWADGANAATDGEGIVNCELPPGAECDAWILGWLWQSKQDDVDAEE